MAYNKRKTGALYEQIAGAYLEKKGYEILEYNYRCKQGEVDIIAKDGEYLVFCEVKFRSGTGNGYPFEAVNYRRQQTLSRCALFYIVEKGLTYLSCRFDVISILGEEITLFQNAFDYIGRS